MKEIKEWLYVMGYSVGIIRIDATGFVGDLDDLLEEYGITSIDVSLMWSTKDITSIETLKKEAAPRAGLAGV